MQVKKILKQIVIGGLIVVTYGSFFSHFDRDLINYFSQKKPYTYAIDYEAYNNKEPLGISIQKEEGDEENLEAKIIENWDGWDTYSVLSWMNNSFSNGLGFTPYYGNLNELVEDPRILLENGDEYIDYFIKKSYQKAETTLLRIRGNKKGYEKLKLKEPLDYITQRVARQASDFTDRVIIELEAPDDGDYNAHNKRVEKVKEINPEYRIATTLDKNEGYDTETGLWDAEKSRKYWENSDIIILHDYFSSPENLEESLKNFKKVAKDKKVWVRIVTGTQRINEKEIKTLEEELEEYERLMKVTKKYADGCIANDSNGIWFYADYPYDNSERFERTKFLYKQFRGIKIN